MMIDSNSIISITEANQNFSKAARIADSNGQAYIFRNNKPKYLLIDLENNAPIEMSDDEKIDFVAARILREHKAAFMELAK